MRILSFSLLLSLYALVRAQDGTLLSLQDEALIGQTAETHSYTSDINRLMKTVVHSLYTDKSVFLRELLSNSNDAIEKIRLQSLTDSSLLETAPNLNISIVVDSELKRIIIRDSGIGMSKESLTSNLGTIARSGTSEFLQKLEKDEGANLIGQFGLGFYSSFLVANKVTVASKSNDDDKQHIFQSEADTGAFSIAEDPRGNTLGRGTEITLWIKDDSTDYLDPKTLKEQISKHSEYGSSPIYLWDEVEVEDEADETEEKAEDSEVKIEVIDEEDTDKKKTKSITKQWTRVNPLEPLWMKDPKAVSEDEYREFYEKTFGGKKTVGWTHFKGDAGSTTFKALIYIPEELPKDFYSKDYHLLEAIKLYVRRVFITSDLGPHYIPKYLDWIKVFIDADGLPLNVGRGSLQKSRAIHQIQKNIIKRTIDLFGQIAEKEPEKYSKFLESGGPALKLGAVEDSKNQEKLLKVLRFWHTQNDKSVSLDELVSNRRKGQKQLFYFASVGEKREGMMKSPFVEKLIGRGYDVLLFSDPMDEMLVSAVKTYGGLKFQDVAKKGLTFGDEDEDDENVEELKTRFDPLMKYLVKELGEYINEVLISTRLTSSPCLIVSDDFVWTGNMERLMSSQNAGNDFMLNFMKSQKRAFEINPHHPLIEGLLDRVEESESDEELKDSVNLLWQTALIRSGFSLLDPHKYFEQVEVMIRRVVGVSEKLKAKTTIKPAPPVDDSPIEEEEKVFDPSKFKLQQGGDADKWANWADMKDEMRKKSGRDEL